MVPLTLLAWLLTPSLPPVTRADLLNFPCEKVAKANQKFAVECLRQFRRRKPGLPQHLWYDVDDREAEFKYCAECWWYLTLARTEVYWAADDLPFDYDDFEGCLRRLRTLLGADNYYRGAMPPPAPCWLFREF